MCHDQVLGLAYPGLLKALTDKVRIAKSPVGTARNNSRISNLRGSVGDENGGWIAQMFGEAAV